tara:strand:+ start:142 stop:360 length:219 start_codon:yes stop_codon:yes gene_type:complete
MSIRRWASYDERGYYSDSSLVDHDLGDWVKYDDHTKIVNALSDQVHNLTQVIIAEPLETKPWDSITGEDYND